MDPVTQDDENKDLAEKRKAAMLAMEGEEGRRHRELLERQKQEEELKASLTKERVLIEQTLETLGKEKEQLELKWIEFNETKAPLEKSLEPIVANEIKVEQEEADIEKKEHTALDPREKQAAEKMRWEVEDRRRLAEKERWKLEDEIVKINDIIKANSERYQALLIEEEKTHQRLNDVIKSLSVY